MVYSGTDKISKQGLRAERRALELGVELRCAEPRMIPVGDSSPTWVNFSVDDKYAYITCSRNSIIMKLDMHEGEVVTEQRSGVDGPYGNHFGWDDRFIYSIGKGEESHNRGKMVGMMDTTTMSVSGARAMNQFYTGCIRGDHGTLHPGQTLGRCRLKQSVRAHS